MSSSKWRGRQQMARGNTDRDKDHGVFQKKTGNGTFGSIHQKKGQICLKGGLQSAQSVFTDPWLHTENLQKRSKQRRDPSFMTNRPAADTVV